ncbi:MAG: hypothetical protein KIS73_02970 [Enhydrobacter sp.]|nr:hypothetical protein [Enhydrobacter sp.]
MNGLTKGALMLVLGAVFTWFLVTTFERRAHEQVNASDAAIGVPSVANAPATRGKYQWQF